MELAFAANLRKIRAARQQTQVQLAEELEIKRAALGSYEEGRAFPKPELLRLMIHQFGVEDILGFIFDPAFELTDQKPSVLEPVDSIVQKKYNLLKGREKAAVDVLLGITRIPKC